MTLSVSLQHGFPGFSLDLAFEAPAGVTALFGRSGSGKTTVVNAVAGLLCPNAGRIALNDTVLFDRAARVNVPAHRRRVGYVFQDARLFPHLSVARNLSYGGTHDADRVIAMLGLGGLLDRRPATLSGGERQRVALGRALMSHPAILLLDEPLAALDAPRKAEILPYLERLRDEVQVPILYVSHDVTEVARLATTLVMIEAGRVLRVGPLADVLADPATVPLLGVREAGAVIGGRVGGYDPDDGLSLFEFDGGTMVLPGRLGDPGAQARVRVAAQDVILALTPPQGLSALNVVSVTVTGIAMGRGPGVAVGLTAGQTRLLARITKRSARAMGLTEGMQVFAILKANAIAPADVGQG
jgi:molybdate transport system ATP-binding protein